MAKETDLIDKFQSIYDDLQGYRPDGLAYLETCNEYADEILTCVGFYVLFLREQKRVDDLYNQNIAKKKAAQNGAR